MQTFNCKLCVKQHSNGGDCSGLVSTNGHSTHMTPLPEVGDWHDIAEDLGYIGPPKKDDRGFPLCAGYDINAHIAFEYNGIIRSLACRSSGSRYILSEAITIGKECYSAIAYRVTDSPVDRYFLSKVDLYCHSTRNYKIYYDTPYKDLPEVTILKVSTEPIDIIQFIPEYA